MKKQIALLFLIFLFSGACISQNSAFNFESNKVFRIKINGIEDFNKADELGRQIEKMELCIFSFVNYQSGIGYFIIDNAFNVPEIIKIINNYSKCSYAYHEEVPLTEDLFLEMYMSRGGIEKIQYSIAKPKEIIMGPHQNLTNDLYNKALSIWEKSYLKTYNDIEKKSNNLPEHHPVYTNTGNPEYDNSEYEKAKQEWIKNYPEEVEQLTGRSYENSTGLKNNPEEKKQ